MAAANITSIRVKAFLEDCIDRFMPNEIGFRPQTVSLTKFAVKT